MKNYELYEWNDSTPIPFHQSLISVCCGAIPWNEIDSYNIGICSKCKDHCSFELDQDE